jgi:hypothetical protein
MTRPEYRQGSAAQMHVCVKASEAMVVEMKPIGPDGPQKGQFQKGRYLSPSIFNAGK